MQYTKDLVFFDKSGTGYGFDYDETNELWTGSIYIEPVSKGLFETEKLIVLQRYVVLQETDGVHNDNPVKTYEYGYPATVYSFLPNDQNRDYYEFKWDEDIAEVDEIQMFVFNSTPCPPEDTSSLVYHEYDCPNIVFADNVRIENLVHDPITYDSNASNPPVLIKYLKNSNWSSSYADINISFCNKDDDYTTFRRDLHLYYVDVNQNETLVGKFTVYAKSIEEDERLTTMCNNFGYDINNIDFSIFQDSDIKEQLIDHDLMNQKRKEILMEGHNIYSYIGSYKSVVNAIRFFGYDNVTIKEWWKNVDIESEHYGKHFMASSYSLKNHEVIRSNSNVTLPSKKYRKTGKLTLAYDINKLDLNTNAQSSYYGHGYPETDEHFTYTIEEAVIKLYGLKRKLEKEFLPLTTRIVDIVGEADSFYASIIRHNMSQNISFCATNYTSNSFTVYGSEDGCFYIEDLRPFGIRPNQTPGHVLPPSGNGIVGDVRVGSANYIGQHQAAYDAESEMNEFGNETLNEYNTNFSPSDHYSQQIPSMNIDDDLNYEPDSANIHVAADYNDIASIASSDVVPPIEMDGNGLFAVGGPTCHPWIYYVQANNSNDGNYYLAEFSSYYPNLNETANISNNFEEDNNTHLPDNEGIPVGALVELRIDERDEYWNNLPFTWNVLGCCNWQYLGLYANNICRAEWIINLSGNGFANIQQVIDSNDFNIWLSEQFTEAEIEAFSQSDLETHANEYLSLNNLHIYSFSIVGMISDGYGDIGVVLPYIGTYDVTMKLYDWNNNVNIVDRPAAIVVYPKQVEFNGWCKIIRNSNQRLTWNDMRTAMYEGLDRASFLGQYVNTNEVDESVALYNFEDNQSDMSLVADHTGPYFWDNLDIDWQSMNHLNWNSMTITGDIPCYFEFGYFDQSANPIDSPEAQDTGVSDSLPGKWLEIIDKDNHYASFRFPNASSSNLNYIADVVRQLNESNDIVLSKFYYSYVWDSNSSHASNPDLNIPEGFHIIATAKNHGRLGDVNYVGICTGAYLAYTDNNNTLHARIDPDNHQISFVTNSVECNPNWEDTVCINNITEIPAYTDVNFNYTNCRILSKTNPRWEFKNLNTGTTYYSTNKNYHRMFKEKGCWKVSLTLDDSNGNTYSASKNILKIV